MDLSDLRIFRAVVAEGGVTRAAQKLHRVQSSVTTRIKQLESELEVELFVREGKRLRLAPTGRTLLDYADRLLGLAEEARAAVRQERPGGVFRLGAMESTAAVRLPDPLTEFFRRFPDVELRLRTGNPRDLSTAVLAGELDAAFIAEPIAAEAFDAEEAFVEELVIVARRDHPPIGADGAPPPAIIAFERGCPHRQRLEDWYQRQGAHPAQTTELASYHAMLGCVVVGMGVALLPRSVLDGFPKRDLVSEHPLPAGLDRARTLLIWRKGRSSPNVRALLDVLAARKPGADRGAGV